MEFCDAALDRDIIAIECNNISVKGAEREGLFFNRGDFDLDDLVYLSGSKNIISTLPLKTGKLAYKCVQPTRTPYNGTKTEAVVGTYATTFNKTLQIVILNHGNYIGEIVDRLASGEFVVALKNKSINDESDPALGAPKAYGYAWEFYGLENGLHLESAVRELYNDDTLAGWLVTLTETDASKAGIFATDALVESLVNGGSAVGDGE